MSTVATAPLITVDALQPFGAIIRPTRGTSLTDIAAGDIVDLMARYKLVVMRGFPGTDEAGMMNIAKRFGPLLRWEFGEVLNLKTVERPQNHLFRNGRVEMHWDGAYLTEVPPYSFFQCIHSSQSTLGGETLFTHTPRVVQHLDSATLARWSGAGIRYSSAKAAHYGGNITVPLLGKHPRTGEPVVRFIEPYNEDNADINPVDVHVEGLADHAQEAFLRDVIARIYAPDVMYRHTWVSGDFLIYDNLALLHGRACLQGNTHRHLQRIHILEDHGSLESRPAVFLGARQMDVHV